jgi:hypothetical protein
MKKSSTFLKKPIDKGKRPCYNEYKFKVIEQNRCNGRKDEVRMSETSLKPVIEKLENLFSKFNEKFYNGELQTPIITVSPDTTKGAYGWCTAWKAWSNKQPEQKKTADLAAMSKEDLENLKKDEGFYEINICAEHLARPFEQVAETLLHEMVHLYNLQIGVQDTSRGGTYHNKKYKEAAEQHGLTVGKDAK